MAKRKNPHAVALGRLGGSVMTERKLAALKRNAQLAGRKPKYQPGDRVRVKATAPLAYRGRTAQVVRTGDVRAAYVVAFRGGEEVTLRTWWIEPLD
jgi:hypothetical protein